MKISIESELAKLNEGLVKNPYGDHASHKYGFLVQGRHYCGIRVSIMHGFRKHRRLYHPIKTVAYLTSSLLNALSAEQMVKQRGAKKEQKRKQEAAQARKSGFRSIAAWRRNEACKSEAIAKAVAESLLQHDPYPDLNEYGIANRDRIHEDSITLVNFSRSRSHRCHLGSFMQLQGTKIERRNAGWNLPDYVPTVSLQPSKKVLPFVAQGRKFAA